MDLKNKEKVKMAKKKQSARRRNQISWSLLGLVFVVMFATVCIAVWIFAWILGGLQQTTQPANSSAVEKSADKSTVSDPNALERNVAKVTDSYLELHWKKDRWFDQNVDLQAKKREILAIIDRNADLSPYAKSMRTLRNQITVSMYGSSNCKINLAKFGHRKSGLEISYMPLEVVLEQNRTRNQYRGDWRAIMLLAVADYPKADYAATVIHEFGHAADHFDGREPAIPQEKNDAYYTNEVLHHDLGAQVINRETGGQYFVAIKKILEKDSATSWSEAISQITLADLQRLDKIVKATDIGYFSANQLIGNYIETAGFLWVNSHGKNDALAEKVKVHRWTYSLRQYSDVQKREDGK